MFVYCKNPAEHVYAIYGENAEFLLLNVTVRALTTVL
jgi:hypothetical protein